MRLQSLTLIASLLPFATASFSYAHDLYSKPEFLVLNDTFNYLLDTQVSSYIDSVKSITDCEIEFMKHNNETYLCTYPPLSNQDLTTEDLQELKTWQMSEILEAKEYAAKALYEGMADECIYYLKDWWTYSFCYGKDIKQFHVDASQLKSGVLPDPKQAVMMFVLGKFDYKPNGALKYDLKLKSEGDVNYLSYKLGLGTVCDLTGKDRSTEVQFYCSPKQELDSVLWIREVNSCEYKMAISTRKICDNPIFAPPEKTSPHKIDCRRILSATELEEFEAKKEELKAKKEETQKNEKLIENKQQQDLESNVLYSDLDFAGGEWKELRLHPKLTAGKNIQSYRDDTSHTLSLLMEKLTLMIQNGAIKNAKGESITAKDEFSVVVGLIDLNEQDVIPVKIVLTKGELLVGIVDDEDDDSEDIYEMDLSNDELDELDDLVSDEEEEEEGERMLFVTSVTQGIPTNVYAGVPNEVEDENFEPFLGDEIEKGGEQGEEQGDSEQDVAPSNDEPNKHTTTAKQVQQNIEDVDQAPLVTDGEEKKGNEKEKKVYYYYDGDEYLQDEEHSDKEKAHLTDDSEVVHDEL
ncbi:hypothetical protein DV495_001076 [Geotrichum candidum]|nr:hypothetical protein DV495_001076 [Geotrichum candidum]